MRIKDYKGDLVELKVGTVVGFKYDVEQYSAIKAIDGGRITVTATEGGYVHQDCHEDCEGCSFDIELSAIDIWID